MTLRNLVGAIVGLLLLGGQGSAADPIELTPSADLFKQLDRDGDGRVEASEVAADHQRLFRRLLATADTNRDGALSSEEFAASLKSRRPERPLETLPKPPKPEESARIEFRRFDLNRDGKLELKEVPEQRRPMFQNLIRLGDKNGDGSLNVQEFIPVYSQYIAGDKPLPPGPGGAKFDPQAMLQRVMQADANKDGKLSKEEAPRRLRERFAQLDTNGDGQLDRQELTAAFERLAKAVGQNDPEALKLQQRLNQLNQKLQPK